MSKLRETFGAALYVASPAWEAVMVQVPAPVIVTLLPETVHVPVAAKLTVNPELAVALTSNAASPNVLLLSALNVIV